MDIVRLVKNQGIKDKRVLAALGKIDRKRFIDKSLLNDAYADKPLAIGFGQTISQPYIVAKSCELLELKGKEKILEIGAGSGYQTAILAALAKEVVAIEVIPELATKIKPKINNKNVRIICDDGKKGFASESPYDGIICAAATTDIPLTWIKQIKDKGRIVMPLKINNRQMLIRLIKSHNAIKIEEHGEVLFVPLI